MPNNSCQFKLVNGQWTQTNLCNDGRGCPPVPMETLNAIRAKIRVSMNNATFDFVDDDELQFDCYDDSQFSAAHYETKVWYQPGGSTAEQLAFSINKPSAMQAPSLEVSSGNPKDLGPLVQ